MIIIKDAFTVSNIQVGKTTKLTQMSQSIVFNKSIGPDGRPQREPCESRREREKVRHS